MQNLEVGKSYEFEVLGLCQPNSGKSYLDVLGPDDHSYKVFNILADQYTNVPNTVTCIVFQDSFDHYYIKQDINKLLQDKYPIGHFYPFRIIDDSARDRNQKQYYTIADDFAEQRWYGPTGKYQIDDDIILEAFRINDKGFVEYKEHDSQSIPDTSTTVVQQNKQTHTSSILQNGPVLQGVDESETVELKTSIVFPPEKNNQPDIDTQIIAILRALLALMNHDGGTLYIGIHDKTKAVLGIQNDLPYLNTGTDFERHYPADKDGYERFIRDSVRKHCGGGLANLYLHFNFPEEEGVQYCRIDVDRANRPIWYNMTELYVRQGPSSPRLVGDNLTQYIIDRMISPKDSTLAKAVKEAMFMHRKEVAANITVKPEEIKYWIVWLTDGTYKKMKNQSNDSNVFKQLPVTDATTDLIVAFCYASGTLNTVKLSNFMSGVTLSKSGKCGMNPNEQPKEIFICHSSCLLAIYSANNGGTEFIKVHHLTDVNTTGDSRNNGGRNQGSYIIPKNQGHVLNFKLITPAQSVNVNRLIAQKADTIRSFGTDIQDITIQKEIDYLDNL